MKRKDYFLLALEKGLHSKLSWIISAFSLVDGVDPKTLGPYELAQSPTGFSYYDPEKEAFVKIEDGVPGKPLLEFKRGISLKAGDLPNLNKDVITTYGNVIFNMCTLVYGFGSKYPFVEGLVSIRKLEQQIARKLKDTVPDNQKNDTDLYCDEYIKFADGIQYLTELNNMIVWGVTEKALTPPPGIGEVKKQLLEKYKDQLDDPIVINKIYNELIKYDTEYLKDDPSENFLISGKLRNVVRRKLFLMQGAEAGLGDRNELDLVTNSLTEGFQPEKFPTLNNIARAGSFDRGSETQLGGVSTKEILRATSNIRIVKGDCGTKLGMELKVDKDNVNKLIDLRVMETNDSILIEDEAMASKYLGKTIYKRSPLFCKLEKTDFCEYCIGKRIADTETGASMAATELGGTFLGIFMSSMHAKELTVAEMDLDTCFS